MKIQKQILTEANLIDTSDSVEEIALDAQEQVEDGSNGEVALPNSSAAALAQEIKDTAEELSAESAVIIPPGGMPGLGTDNEITRALDEAFAHALEDKEDHMYFNNNVLISGLPGSGKTASIYDWAKSRKDVNLVYINAKNNDLQAYIDGYSARVFGETGEDDYITQLYSNNLAELEKPNSVLFLDEYNRQTKPQVRAALLTLIQEHKISGKDEHKTHTFKNMLFTIACINPAVPTDRGAAKLNQAERSRFAHKIKGADSSVESSVDYFKKQFDQQISILNPKHPNYLKKLERYLRIQDLGLFIVSHRDFGYDTEDRLDDLDFADATMLNQRSLVDGLGATDGKVDKFKAWLKRSSDYLSTNVEMIENILTEYIEPSFEDLCKYKGIDLASGNIAAALQAKAESERTAANSAAETEENESTVAIEDDDDFFTNSGVNAGTARVKNPQEVMDAIRAAAKNW